MAKQTSIITLNGAVGGLSFYKTKDGYFARAKGGVSKSRIMSDPKYARTRENLREFATAADGAKFLKDTFRDVLLKASDSRLYNRIYSAMLKILKTDPVNKRGDRKVIEGDWNLLTGLEINGRTRLGSTLYMEFTIADAAASLDVSFSDFNPADHLMIPEGTTHFKIFASGVSLDLTSKERSTFSVDSGLLPVGDPVTGLSLSVDKSGLTESHKAFVLGVEFIQEVNGQEYPLNNGAHNAASILLTEVV
ncbi:hypothetical protein [Echinicola salinicaeni]|uniref:hypothetical protein n=1 Tax=Echinicola salinicaeni TaxID=2762757 RepID=UPI0016491697|nr:hypothetical protein [Echinicola salinicaeni]